jgi:hypothetical protein
MEMMAGEMRKILINYYPNKKSWFEWFGKELRYAYRALVSIIFHGRIKRVLAYPHLPGSKAIIFKLVNHSKWVITNNPRKKAIFAIAWEDASVRSVPEILKEKSKIIKVLNLHNNNILKTYIEEYFYEAFGYRTRIDPQLFKGIAVCKSEYNATHSGTIVECPVDEVQKDCIYQILIDNRNEEDLFEDIRVPIIGKIIPYVYIKLKEESARFETRAQKVLLEEVDEYISAEEKANILKFTASIGLDFGEIDVMRNRNDGKLYIVDVNNTPYGPPANLPDSDAQKALRIQAEELIKII